jgi:hypothetical protein
MKFLFPSLNLFCFKYQVDFEATDFKIVIPDIQFVFFLFKSILVNKYYKLNNYLL